jgi:hypothetical protein
MVRNPRFYLNSDPAILIATAVIELEADKTNASKKLARTVPG